MTALNRLVSLLNRNPTDLSRIKSNTMQLEKIIAQLETHNKTAGAHVPEDLQRKAVNNFWYASKFENLKEARHVAFGLCLPVTTNGISIMDDNQRLQAVFNEQTGIGQWLKEPRKFRRCYQGLIRSYFHSNQKKVSETYKQNWKTLRAYLYQHSHNIIDDNKNPEWVGIALANTALFDKNPCAPYAAEVLSGNTEKFDDMCENLGIQQTSWFHRELILEQIRQVTQKEYTEFVSYIPQLITLLKENAIHRNQGLRLILNSYASATSPAPHDTLRNAAVEWWGNPWLPSNDSQWGGVEKSAREMVSFWLKSEFVEAFFSKLAEDGLGDTRRAKFWLGYVKHMDDVRFGLGANVLNSRDPDFVKLREKMKGSYKELTGAGSANNAIIMRMGNLLAVEFSDNGAFYCYDTRELVPFSFDRPLEVRVDAKNSLKQSNHFMRERHSDSGGSTWEEKFSYKLKRHLNISSTTAETHSFRNTNSSQQTQSKLRSKILTQEINDNIFRDYIAAHKFPIVDKRNQSGNLWIITNDKNIEVNAQLLKFGFRYKPDKGWWKSKEQ